MFSIRRDFAFALLNFVLFTFYHPTECVLYRLITEALQNNVAGAPLTHNRTTWDFNPDVSQKRRSLYSELYGYRGTKFIERLGIGTDGKESERRAQQQFRDVGKLNGEHYKNVP